MENRVDVFLIHGVAKTIGADYYDKFVYGLREKLPIGFDCTFHPINYSTLLEDKETQIYDWMQGLGYQKLRKFGCTLAADVLAYANTKRGSGPGDFYYDVNALLYGKIAEVSALYPNGKKVILCHSLGSIIGFDYVWNGGVDHLITLGNPFTYFTPRYKDFGEPPQGLKAWTNFYCYFDPISTPVSRNPKFPVVKDVSVKVYNPADWLPLRAHSVYWSSDQVSRQIAQILLSV